jgi:hypothetical protein
MEQFFSKKWLIVSEEVTHKRIINCTNSVKQKLYPLHAMEAQGGRGVIAPTHT